MPGPPDPGAPDLGSSGTYFGTGLRKRERQRQAHATRPGPRQPADARHGHSDGKYPVLIIKFLKEN